MGRWFRNHPHLLELAYRMTSWLLFRLRPIITGLGYQRLDRWFSWFEEPPKKILFDCRMCGQCILHQTGMTCPMTCPKFIRNGPCGGVRPNGNCEVKPDMKCVWVEAYERTMEMTVFSDEMELLQPPVNHSLQGSSAWINSLSGKDKNLPVGWVKLTDIHVLGTENHPE
jgi:hypothetical protein